MGNVPLSLRLIPMSVSRSILSPMQLEYSKATAYGKKVKVFNSLIAVGAVGFRDPLYLGHSI